MSSLPILLAKDKNARFMKDDYKIGWLAQDEKSWLWITNKSINVYKWFDNIHII